MTLPPPEGHVVREATVRDADELARLRWQFRIEAGTQRSITVESFVDEMVSFVREALGGHGMRSLPSEAVASSDAFGSSSSSVFRIRTFAVASVRSRTSRTCTSSRRFATVVSDERSSMQPWGVRRVGARAARSCGPASDPFRSTGVPGSATRTHRLPCRSRATSPSGARRGARGTCARSRRPRPREPNPRRCPPLRTAAPSCR